MGKETDTSNYSAKSGPVNSLLCADFVEKPMMKITPTVMRGLYFIECQFDTFMIM